MNKALSQSVGPKHFTVLLLSAFSSLATLLAGLVLYRVSAMPSRGARWKLGANSSRAAARR